MKKIKLLASVLSMIVCVFSAQAATVYCYATIDGGTPVQTLENVKVKWLSVILIVFQKIPAETEYRKNVEAFTKYRRGIVQQNEDVSIYWDYMIQIKTIERIIGCGQVEELVQQAKDELSLIEDYYRWISVRQVTEQNTESGRDPRWKTHRRTVTN